METLTPATATACREFTWADHPSETVLILIGRPYPRDTGEWVCPYRIVGAGHDFCSGICGTDSMQALTEVFKIIDSVLIGNDLRLLQWGEPFFGFSGDPDMARLWQTD